ncbi:MAG TPA: hypothetical protein VGJ91_21260 [Polyangiaceae bacterium]|jgi:hypothetical protein
MKNIVLSVPVVLIFATTFPATAQTPAPTKAPTQGQAQTRPANPPATASAPQPEVKEKPAKRAHHRVPSTEDARVCLEFPTTMQIIKCSEKYRWARASTEGS